MAEVRQRPGSGRIKPEWLILILLILSVPLLGIYTYRRVEFEFNNMIAALASHPCTFAEAGGEWDMSPLRRVAGQCTASNPRGCKNYLVHRHDEDFHFNVCGNAVQKPAECTNLLGEENVRKAVGYQTADGVCYYMGLLSTGKWSLISKRDPTKGVKLTYTGGSQCDGATQRSTQFFFDCNRRAGVGRPVALLGDCDFVVTWETALACPNRQSMAWSYAFWALLFTAAYLALGLAYNVRFKDMPMEMESVPHIEPIRRFGGFLLDAAEVAWGTVGGACEVAWGAASERIPYIGAAGSVAWGYLAYAWGGFMWWMGRLGLRGMMSRTFGEQGGGAADSRSEYDSF